MKARKLAEEWIHLGLGATAEPQPPFNGMEWFDRYSEAHARDGQEARLVSQYRFTQSWDMWEMHPHGAEVVVCTGGDFILIQDVDGKHVHTPLARGEYAINPPGTWHTADVEGEAEALFITAGIGTRHRPRDVDA